MLDPVTPNHAFKIDLTITTPEVMGLARTKKSRDAEETVGQRLARRDLRVRPEL